MDSAKHQCRPENVSRFVEWLTAENCVILAPERIVPLEKYLLEGAEQAGL